MKCLLCEGISLVELKRVQKYELLCAWQRFGIHFRNWGEDKLVRLYQCWQCGIEFWHPTILEEEDFYEQLSQRQWYYSENKWEYEEAIKYIKNENLVLEIGFGEGAFLQILKEKEIESKGIEKSANAIEVARQRGLDVELVDIGCGYVKDNQNAFDVVCSFQVLEHISEPRRFLDEILNILKPRGYLIISTPNQGSFIRFAPCDLLNMPPHHVTRWRERTYEIMAELLGVRLISIAKEPLDVVHAEWSAICRLNAVLRLGIDDPGFIMQEQPYLVQGLFFLAKHLGKEVNASQRLRRMQTGHSLFGVFQKV